MAKALDLTGQKFGKLTSLQRVENGKDGKVKWECLCECGNHKIVSAGDLKSGCVRSCGCLLSPSLVGKNYMYPYSFSQIEGKVLNVYSVTFLVYAADYKKTGFPTHKVLLNFKFKIEISSLK